MDWSPDSARNAYLDTLKLRTIDVGKFVNFEAQKLCSAHREKHNSEICTTSEPESKEFISGLAAGMNAKLIVEVAPEASPSTIALAAAARQTGGKLVCIVPEPKLDESQQVIDDSGLQDIVEFKTGDPVNLLANYKNIDFSLVDCKSENYEGALEVLDVNPMKAVVIADNLGVGREGVGGDWKGARRVKSMKLSMGKGMEVTMIGKGHSRSRSWSSGNNKNVRSKWVTKIDSVTGEKHIFRVTK